MQITKRAAGAMMAAVFLVAACGNSAATPSASAAPSSPDGWTPEYVDGKLQPLPDGFPNQPITLIVVDDAGSDDGIYARAAQAAAEKISPVSIKIADRPDLGSTFGTFEALNNVAAQPGGKDGYTLVVATQTGSVFDLLTTPVVKDLGVTLDSINWVANTERVPWVIVTPTGRPWGRSLEDFLTACKAAPGTLKYLSRGPGASVNTAFNQYMLLAGCEVNEVIGGSNQEIAISMGAGVADIAISIVGVQLPIIEDGKVVLLGCTGNTDPCPGGWDPAVSPASKVVGLEVDPWGSTRGYAVPQDVPDLHRAWLTELILKINADTDYQANRAQLPGLAIVNLDHDQAREISVGLLNGGYDVLKEMGGLDPSVTSKP